MDEKMLRETFDHNLNESFRLKQLENGLSVFTVLKTTQTNLVTKSMEKPLFAHIRVTSRCNLKCAYCYAEDETTSTDMTDESILSVVKMCHIHGILCITWTGGEPLIRDNFYDVISLAYNYGIKQTILTNGTLLERVHREKWPKDNINFQVSLNEVWIKFEEAKESIYNARKLIEWGYDVVLTIMLEPVPIKLYMKLIDFLIKVGIKTIRFGFKVPAGLGSQDGSITTYEMRIKDQLPELMSLKQIYKNEFNISYQFEKKSYHETGLPRRFLLCEAGTTEIYSDNNGDVYPCPMLNSLKKLYCGNIFHNTWEEIWDAPAMELLRKIPDCRDCTYNCGVWCRALKFFMDGNLYGKSRYCLKELNV